MRALLGCTTCGQALIYPALGRLSCPTSKEEEANPPTHSHYPPTHPPPPSNRVSASPRKEAEPAAVVGRDAEAVGEHEGVVAQQRVGHGALGAVHHQLRQLGGGQRWQARLRLGIVEPARRRGWGRI